MTTHQTQRGVLLGVVTLALACGNAHAQAPAAPSFDSGTISGLGARNIGSATMSGRVSAIAAHVADGKTKVLVGQLEKLGVAKALFIDGLVTGTGNLTVQNKGDFVGNQWNTSCAVFTSQGTAAQNTYSGNVTVNPLTTGASGGSYLFSSSAQLAFTFTGTQFDVLYVQHPALGSFVIEVDGAAVQTVDSHSEQTHFRAVASVRGLANGQHSVVIRPVAGAAAIDAVTLQQGALLQ